MEYKSIKNGDRPHLIPVETGTFPRLFKCSECGNLIENYAIGDRCPCCGAKIMRPR